MKKIFVCLMFASCASFKNVAKDVSPVVKMEFSNGVRNGIVGSMDRGDEFPFICVYSGVEKTIRCVSESEYDQAKHDVGGEL